MDSTVPKIATKTIDSKVTNKAVKALTPPHTTG